MTNACGEDYSKDGIDFFVIKPGFVLTKLIAEANFESRLDILFFEKINIKWK